MIVEQASINRNLNSISSLSIWSVSVRGGGGGRGNVACHYLKLCISDSRTSLYQQESKLYQLFVYPVCLSERWGWGRGMQHVFTLSCVLVIVEQASINRNLNSISSLSIQSVSVRGGGGGRGNVACLYLKLCISDSRTSLYQQESKLYQLFVYPVCLSEGWGWG